MQQDNQVCAVSRLMILILQAPGRAGVRTAESIRDGFLVLACGDMTGVR